MSTTSGYQDIFTEFIEGVKESEAQWYSIKPLHYDISSLADFLEVQADNLATEPISDVWSWKAGTRQQLLQLPSFQI
jgi:hypothetical protein